MLMVYAGVEEDVLQQVLRQRRAVHALREPAVTAPVVGNGSPAVRQDEPQRGEIPEQVTAQQLHEDRGVPVEVMRARRVEVRVARRRDVDHRRNVQLGHRLIQRVPRAVRQGDPAPVPARRVRIEVAADEAEFLNAAPEFRNAVRGRRPRRLRQLADAGEVAREQLADAMDQVVAYPGPLFIRAGRREMVSHARRAR